MQNKIDSMNKTELFLAYQKEFNSLKAWIEQKTLSLEQVKKIKGSLYDWIKWLKNNLPEEDKLKFQKILDKLNNSDENLTDEDIETIWKIFLTLENKQLEQTDLEQLKTNIKELKSSKNKLSSLKQTVNSKLKEKEKKLKEKINNYKKKLTAFSVEHPIWTKALILLLPANLLVLFKKKKNIKKDTTEHKLWWQILWWALSEIKEIFWEIEGYVAHIATIFFSWFAPKEMKELLLKIKSDFADVDPAMLDKLKGNFWNIAGKLKKYNPEKLKEWKDKLFKFMKKKWTAWFSITDTDKLKKYKKVIKKWIEWLKNNNKVKDFFEKIEDGKINFDNLKLDDILAWLGAGAIWTMKLIWLLVENKLISPEQIWLKLAKKWWKIILQTALFFPKMIYTGLWDCSLEDFYDLIENNQLSEVNKNMFLVMLYRAINTPPFSILQHIAALPGYGLSMIVNVWQDIKKWQIFFEALKWNKINKQLDLLSKIEKEIKGRDWTIFEWIKKSLNYYKKWIAVSYAFWQAWWDKVVDKEKFEKILNNMWLEKDDDIWKLLKDLKNSKNYNFKKTEINSFIKGMWEEIKSIGRSPEYAGSRWVIEDLKSSIWWNFSKTNFFIKTTSNLSESLEKNAKILEQPYMLKIVEKVFKKLKYAKDASWNVKLLDLSHLTKNPQSFRDFTNDLKILARESPDLLKFIFRDAPVILLWKDMIDDIKKREYTDIFKTYLEFVPIVWPFAFAYLKYNQDDLSLANFWWTVFWCLLDAVYVVKTKTFNILKLSAMPVIDTAKFIWGSYNIIWRYANWTYKTLKWLKEGEPILWKMKKIFEWGKWRVAFAAALLATLYYGYEYVSKDSKDWDKTAINVLKRLASKKWWLEVANNEIFNNWNKYDDNMKKGLIWSFIWYHLWLDPVSFENYVNDIKKDGSIFILSFNDKALNSPYLKDKLQEIRPVVRQLDKKLAVDIQVSPWNLLIV